MNHSKVIFQWQCGNMGILKINSLQIQIDVSFSADLHGFDRVDSLAKGSQKRSDNSDMKSYKFIILTQLEIINYPNIFYVYFFEVEPETRTFFHHFSPFNTFHSDSDECFNMMFSLYLCRTWSPCLGYHQTPGRATR